MDLQIKQNLQQGVEQLALNLTQKQIDQLSYLLSQLLKWNKTYNLTAITEADEALKLHLLDSLAIVPYWTFRKTLDVGTGPGFPGLPLAIALPELEFHLLDSNSKKIRFIRQQIHELGLTNVTPHHARVEAFQSEVYDCVVSRAFASLKDMLQMTQHLVAQDGCWMAMKGEYLPSELEEIPKWAKEVNTYRLSVPKLNAKRCIIQLAQRND
ncbi:16S rRNA (guanine(527)-N(7))-methyltransferase RsmG [Aliikangiella maris]|uniref:Ribosomal RNA small subunit methyltransferase G n=2 Tax=Aliikangiella maris TaxID=3162458 RepID=A0ABV2BX49_9GAMM